MFIFGSSGFLASVLFAGVLLAVGGLLLVRKFVDHKDLIKHHDVAGYLLTLVGTLYAVILGLVVVGAVNTFQQARLTVEQEAMSLRSLFHLAEGLPDPPQVQIMKDCLSYADAVATDEWKKMDSGTSSPQAHHILRDLSSAVIRYQPVTQNQVNLHANMLTKLDDLSVCRHARLTVANPQYDFIIWSALIFGGAILIVFTYFFGVEKLYVQVLMTALLTLILGLNLTIIALFGYPYSGDIKVSAAPFGKAVEFFDEELGAIQHMPVQENSH